MTASVNEFTNDCHESDTGRFCEGNSDPGSGKTESRADYLKRMNSTKLTPKPQKPEEKVGFFKRLFGGGNKPELSESMKAAQVRAKQKAQTDAADPREKNTRAIETEKVELKKLVDSNSGRLTKNFRDTWEAEVRSAALAQGRVATKKEIDDARSGRSGTGAAALIGLKIIT